MVAEHSGLKTTGRRPSLSDEYRRMTGTGEVWIGQDGLPLRMTMRMKFPPTKTGERIEAHLSTDFFVKPGSEQAASLYPLGWLSGAARKMVFNLMVWLDHPAAHPSEMVLAIISMGFILLLLYVIASRVETQLSLPVVACLLILCVDPFAGSSRRSIPLR
jgi:hypothetical protein